MKIRLEKTRIPNHLLEYFETDLCSSCYVCHTLLWAKEAWRVLRNDGVFFLNLADSYAGSGGSGGDYNSGGIREGQPKYKQAKNQYQSKCQLLIPHRVAIALLDDGWCLRNTIIWHKTSAMPESVTDRFSKKYEYIFMFTKQEKYYFDLDSIREPHKEVSIERLKRAVGNSNKWVNGASGQQKHGLSQPRPNYKDRIGSMQSKEFDGADYLCGNLNPLGKNPGDVWNIPTQPSGRFKSLGDYEGIDGKTYKASLDCPIYEHRLCAEKKQKERYDEQLNSQMINNSGNKKNPSQGLVPESVSTHTLYAGQKGNVCFSEPKVHSMETRKISGRDMANSQNLHHNKHMTEKPDSTLGVVVQQDSEIAISHNRKNRKNDHASLKQQTDTSSFEKADDIADKLVEHEKDEHIYHIDENNILEASALGVQAINNEEQILSGISNISCVNNNKDKCTCQQISDAHFAMWPERLVERMVKCSTKAGDTVLDPFAGSGTTLKVAKELQRIGIGIDLGYEEIQERRLSKIQRRLFF